ncbi:hypothetical protein [Leifsonia sp. NPDC058248]|uniref:hypothetical protein n=1 Tax=Leifsonia sp. NPDC058248 TaxID=3346402 RepID=UPI0036DB0DBC
MAEEDATGYWGAPEDIVTEVGRITISGTALEAALYRLAGGVGAGDLRNKPASVAASKLAAKATELAAQRGLEDHPKLAAFLVRLERFPTTASDALEERGRVVHSTYVSYRGDDSDEWEPGHSRTREGTYEAIRPVVRAEFEAVRRQVEEAALEGWSLFSMLFKGELD